MLVEKPKSPAWLDAYAGTEIRGDRRRTTGKTDVDRLMADPYCGARRTASSFPHARNRITTANDPIARCPASCVGARMDHQMLSFRPAIWFSRFKFPRSGPHFLLDSRYVYLYIRAVDQSGLKWSIVPSKT